MGLCAPDLQDRHAWRKTVAELTTQGLRPPMKTDRSCAAAQILISDCWAQDPTDRPSMRQVVDRLEAMKLDFIGFRPA